MTRTERDDGNAVFGSTQQEHNPRLGIRKGFRTGSDISSDSWRMCRHERNKQTKEECPRQDSIRKSSKDKWKVALVRIQRKSLWPERSMGEGSTWR